jgi:serralysin
MANTITGTSGSDDLTGTTGADIIKGLDGNDTLSGAGGADTLVGGKGNDLLSGGSGVDSFLIDDRLWGRDTVTDWGKGDKIDVSALGVADIETLQPYLSQNGLDAVFATFFGSYSESITISDTDVSALAFQFNTSKTGLHQEGTSFNDVLFGGNGGDTLDGGERNDELNGGAGNDTLIGGAGSDLMRGGAGRDLFLYTDRDFGNDAIEGWARGDKVDLSFLGVADLATLQPYLSQDGLDAVLSTFFGSYTESITVSDTDLASLSFVFNTSRIGLHQVGTDFSDVIFGGNGSDTLDGGERNDELNGGAGNDTLIGGAGSDLMRGGAGRDLFLYADRYFGNDTIEGWGTGDKIDLKFLGVADLATLQPYLSQDGLDSVLSTFFGSYTESITVTDTELASLSFVFNTSRAGLHQVGTSFNDVLFGGRGADTLDGGDRNDELNGGAGNDTLIGGAGSDVLRGGVGRDLFLFAAGDSAVTHRDLIADFSRAQHDRIDLSAIDANTGQSGDQAFKVITGDFTALGQMRITDEGDHFLVELNYAGSNTVDMAFDVVSVTTLAARDFVL